MERRDKNAGHNFLRRKVKQENVGEVGVSMMRQLLMKEALKRGNLMMLRMKGNVEDSR